MAVSDSNIQWKEPEVAKIVSDSMENVKATNLNNGHGKKVCF